MKGRRRRRSTPRPRRRRRRQGRRRRGTGATRIAEHDRGHDSWSSDPAAPSVRPIGPPTKATDDSMGLWHVSLVWVASTGALALAIRQVPVRRVLADWRATRPTVPGGRAQAAARQGAMRPARRTTCASLAVRGPPWRIAHTPGVDGLDGHTAGLACTGGHRLPHMLTWSRVTTTRSTLTRPAVQMSSATASAGILRGWPCRRRPHWPAWSRGPHVGGSSASKVAPCSHHGGRGGRWWCSVPSVPSVPWPFVACWWWPLVVSTTARNTTV